MTEKTHTENACSQVKAKHEAHHLIRCVRTSSSWFDISSSHTMYTNHLEHSQHTRVEMRCHNLRTPYTHFTLSVERGLPQTHTSRQTARMNASSAHSPLEPMCECVSTIHRPQPHSRSLSHKHTPATNSDRRIFPIAPHHCLSNAKLFYTHDER